MPGVLSITVDREDEERVRAVLNPAQYRQAIFQAVSRTTKKLTTVVKKKLKERTFVKAKYLNRVVFASVPKKGTDAAPEGQVVIKNKRLPLTAFKVRASRKGGVFFQAGPDTQPIVFRHAFKATMVKAGDDGEHEGHDGVFVRAKHLPTRGPNAGKGKLTPRGFAGRLAIKELKGPGLLKMINVPDVISDIHVDTRAEFRKQLQSQVDRFTKPKSAAPPAADA